MTPIVSMLVLAIVDRLESASAGKSKAQRP
jgi:hypothetical protein